MTHNNTFLTNEQLNQIRSSVDIVDVISGYIPLTIRGKNYFGVCPFHDDHSPSMSVSKDKQIFTCWSCGAAGNVFKFIMDYENISFIEAVSIVADKAGIKNHNSLRNAFKIKKRAENIIILDVTATAFSPAEAVTLSKIFASLSPEYLSAIFPNVLVNVVAEAEGAVVVSPRTFQTTTIGFMIGFFLAFIVYLIMDMFDQTIHTEDDLSDNFQLAILGVIPDFLTAPAGGYNDGDK